MKPLKERLDEAAYSYETPSHRECYGCCQSESDYEKCFKAGANWMQAEMQKEIDELVKAVEEYTDLDHAPELEEALKKYRGVKDE